MNYFHFSALQVACLYMNCVAILNVVFQNMVMKQQKQYVRNEEKLGFGSCQQKLTLGGG